jgi:hypothetical protein
MNWRSFAGISVATGVALVAAARGDRLVLAVAGFATLALVVTWLAAGRP